MPDLGQPSSYMTLEKGMEIVSSDGAELGKIEHVLAEPDLDVFDGIVLDTSVLPGGHRFVDADQVAECFERGAQLKIDRAAAEALPEPKANPAAMEADPTEEPDSGMEQRLHRAWELLSGKRPGEDG